MFCASASSSSSFTLRSLIAQRRLRLASFHLRDRALRVAWGIYRSVVLGRQGVQRRARLRGEFLRYRNCASTALGTWQQACVRGLRAHMHRVRGTLFWKLYRNTSGFRALQSHAARRRLKREMLRVALAEHILARKRAACAEFLQVAMASRADSEFAHSHASSDLSTVFARWKSALDRRRSRAPQSAVPWGVHTDHPSAYGAGVVGAHFHPVGIASQHSSEAADKVLADSCASPAGRSPLLRAAPRTEIPPALQRGPPPSPHSKPSLPSYSRFLLPHHPYNPSMPMAPVSVVLPPLPPSMSKMQPRLPCSNVVGVVDGRLTLTDTHDVNAHGDCTSLSESVDMDGMDGSSDCDFMGGSADPKSTKSALLQDLLLFIDEFKHLV
jgi:hypothetical protein